VKTDSGSLSAVIGNRRWVVCALLFFATTINYMDRQLLSLLKPVLDLELHWTNAQFGWVNSLFQGAYALSYLGFGWFIDRFGTKIGYAVSIAAWSVAAAAHALVNTISGFAVARVALGLGEGGNFPAAIKTVAEWFPKKERAFATTVFNSGANVGALIAPALVPPLALSIGWHGTFLVAGGAGLVWLIFWWICYEVPSRARKLSGAERAYIESDGDGAVQGEKPLPWRAIIGRRQTWAYLLARILTDPVWWFFLIWLPDYFKKTRGMDLKTMGLPLVAIYALVTVLSISGGWTTKWLADRGWTVTRTRRVSLFVFACCVIPVAVATKLPVWGAVLLIGLAGGAHQAWSATLFTTVSDVFPRRAVASVIGLGGLMGSLAGMVFPVVCGMVLDAFGGTGYAILFGYCSVAYLLAFGLNSLLCPRFDPIEQRA
jgi:ACS family hexuronate transporter-like MFS transporter